MSIISPAPHNIRRQFKTGVALATLAAILALSACSQTGQSGSSPDATATSDEAQAKSSITPDTLNVADAAIASGNPGMALSVSQSVLQSDPNNIDALVHEGNAYYALNRCEPAKAAYQLALKYDPHASEAETGLGRCLIKTDPVQAIAALQAAVADDPGNAAALNDLGIAYDLTGNFAAAVDPYHKALLADPAMTAVEINLGLSLALSGHGEDALQYLGPLATGQDATPKIRENYALALVSVGEIQQARDVLAIDLPPDQVQRALDGYQALIAANISQPSPPPAAAPTVDTVSTPPVTAAPIEEAPPASQPMSAPVPLAPAAAPVAAPAPMPAPMPAPAAKPHYSSPPAATQNPNAAYVGPSPIPGAISSSAATPAAPGPAQPAVAMAPVAPPPTPIATTAHGHVAVQIAALDSESAARHSWHLLTDRAPVLLAGKSPDIEKASVHGKTFYRLRIGGFGSKVQAAKFCAELSSTGNGCTVADF
ncbi:SPOR domain-containing protein [Acidocella sp.]|uniref:SPOR domain-containing protein n=1 Tax=Acidocella sp. TaxID=50710 RepID=UPI00262F2ADA|nr:SPOR domain-containing protein [Acidocella sp.]